MKFYFFIFELNFCVGPITLLAKVHLKRPFLIEIVEELSILINKIWTKQVATGETVLGLSLIHI